MRRIAFIFSLLLVLVPLSSFAQILPPVNPATVSGDIQIAGAPVLFPVTDTISTVFSLEGYTGTITIDSTSSNDGFDRLCNGLVDIALADRQISPAELNTCSANGRPPIAFRVATSAVIVAVNRLNNFIDNLSATELQAVFGTALNWSEIRATYPEQPIARYGTGTSSSEFNLFATVVFGGDTNRLSTALGAQFNDDVNVSLGRVAESPYAIAFFDANFVLQNNTLIRGVMIDGVEPNFANVSDTLYPLSRPLILYTNATVFQEKPQVVDFMNYYLSSIETEAAAAGLFPAPVNSLIVARNTWLSSTGQTVPPTATATQAPLPITTEEPLPIVTEEIPPAPAEAFSPEVQTLLINARLDLEALAIERLGINRPEGWSASLDINNPQLPILIRLDLELMAASVYGIENRPPNWFGAINSIQLAIARDIRHDLEILADSTYQAGNRPLNWEGGNPVYSCDRDTQALVSLLENNGLYVVTINPLDPNFCALLSRDVALFTEINLLNPNIQLGAEGVEIPREAQIDTDIAVAFYDINARQRAGVIPFGAQVSPIARSYNGFSKMTLVEGDGFLVFIEYQSMNIERDQWLLLPDVSAQTFETQCNVIWCG